MYILLFIIVADITNLIIINIININYIIINNNIIIIIIYYLLIN